MSSEQFQAAHDSIYVTGRLLLQYLQEMRAGRRTEGDDTKGLQSVEDEITKAINALKNQKYQVAVIAAMKAGKSTFLNAVIGADVLASESEACTVCRTDVRPVDVGQVPRLLEYRQGQRHPVSIAEGDAGEIRQKFLERTHDIRAMANLDKTIRFEMWHPIEAISKYPSLAGFTLVDTPGPNEWESANFNTVALKHTALEALRTCDGILFVLDYTSFRDNTNSELLKDVIEQRREFLAENTGKIYFILNKVDRKSQRDREIADVIEDLKKDLIKFGIPEPNIYPVSAWQGLLAKLIHQGTATDSQEQDFFDFFAARYAEKDERGRRYIPASDEIAPQALQDSGIPTIEESVIQTVVRNSGWNLLSDALSKIDKSAKAIEDTLNAQIRGWEIAIEELKEKVEEYKRQSESATRQVRGFKKSVEQQEKKLVSQFKWEINKFAERAKLTIEEEFYRFYQSHPSEVTNSNKPRVIPIESDDSSLFEVPQRLIESLRKGVSRFFTSANPYKIRCNTEEEVQKVKQDINGFCTVLLKEWWTSTQDQLSREGTQIRQELVRDIREYTQLLSNELSKHLGEALEISMNISPIQFPSFEFKGIDAQVRRQAEAYTRWSKERRTKKNFLCPDTTYEVDVPVKEERSFYELDLRQTLEAINREIDNKTSGSLAVVERVIKKQVSEDFRNAEQQINDYIDRFQAEFDRLLRERETKEVEADQIRATLETQKTGLNEYLHELTSIRASLDSWKPVPTSQVG